MYEHRVPLADAIGSADLATEVSLTTLRMCLRRSRLPLCACVISAGRACVRACLSLYECYLCVCVCVCVCVWLRVQECARACFAHTLSSTPFRTLLHTRLGPLLRTLWPRLYARVLATRARWRVRQRARVGAQRFLSEVHRVRGVSSFSTGHPDRGVPGMSTQVQLVFAARRRAKAGAEHELAAARDWAQAERVVAACGAHSQLHRVYVHALARHCDAQ